MKNKIPQQIDFFSHLKYKESIVLVNNPVAYKDMPAIIKR